MAWRDVLEAKLVTELGLSQEVAYGTEERRRIAIHEAGHALVAELAGRRVAVASILRRADALGLVSHTDDEERYVHTVSDTSAMLRIALAGLVAEELVFGEASTGVVGDLAAATTLAARMVGAMGVGGSRVSFEAAEMGGAGNLVAKTLADESTRAAVERLLAESEQQAGAIVAEHRDTLEALAVALAERDELSGEDVRAIVRGRARTGRYAQPRYQRLTRRLAPEHRDHGAGGQERTEGDLGPQGRSPVGQPGQPEHRTQPEADEQPGRHLEQSQPAEVEPDQPGEADVAEAHASGCDEVQGQEEEQRAGGTDGRVGQP